MILPNAKTAVHKDNLLGFPLILASNLKVQNQNQNFTPEYIIPQLILECIIKLREEGIENKDKIAGVQYKSIHKDERDLIFDERDHDKIFYNYAIPPYEIKDSGVRSE